MSLQQQQKKEQKVAGEASAGPSAEAQPHQFGTIPSNSTFSFNTGEDNALARYARKETELEETKKEYHELLVQRDAEIAKLDAALKSAQNNVSIIRKERDGLQQDQIGYQATAEEATAAKRKAEIAYNTQKGTAEYDREQHEKIYKQCKDDERKIKGHQQYERQLKEQISKDAATLQELHTKVDDLEAQKANLQSANSNLAIQHEGTTTEVSQATQEFEQMFNDLGRELDLNGYISHVRDLLSTGQLKRQDSSLSLQHQLSPQKSDQELPNIKDSSLFDQLAAVDDASSEKSVPVAGDADDDDDDDDDTLTSLGLGRTWNEYDYFLHIQNQEKQIIDLKRANEELLAKAQTVEAATTTATTDNATQTEGDADITSQTDAVAAATIDDTHLSIQLYPGLATTPLRPRGRKIIRQRVKMINDSPASVSELWERLPFLTKLIIFMLLSFCFFLVASTMGERHILTSANDLTRRSVIRMGEGGITGYLAPMLTKADDLFGVDTTIFG